LPRLNIDFPSHFNERSSGNYAALGSGGFYFLLPFEPFSSDFRYSATYFFSSGQCGAVTIAARVPRMLIRICRIHATGKISLANFSCRGLRNIFGS
jgi:hypothetical protein